MVIKDKKKIISVLILVVIFLISVNIFIFVNRPIFEKTYEIKAVFGEKIGMVINDSVLDFGELMPGMSSTKKINFTNNYDFPIKIKVLIKGNVSSYIYGDNEFYLDKGEDKTYSINLIIPSDAEKNNYTGKLIFDFYRNSSVFD